MNWNIPYEPIVTFAMNNGINIYLISAPRLGGWLLKKRLTMKISIDDVAREEIRTIHNLSGYTEYILCNAMGC